MFCYDHPDKAIEVYCEDHSTPCCTLCATLSHRKCENVTSIQKAASGIKDKSQIGDLSKQLEDYAKEITEAIENRKGNTKIRTDAISCINEVYDKLKNDVLSSKKRLCLKLKEEGDNLSSFKSTIDNWKTVLDISNKHGSDQQCLVELNKILAQKQQQKKKIKEAMESMRNIEVTFKLGSDINEFKNDATKCFGSLQINESLVMRTMSKERRMHIDLNTANIVVLKTLEFDKGSTVSGLFIGDHSLLLTSSSTQALLKYDQNGNFISKLQLTIAPRDITAMGNSIKVAVSSPYTTIYIIDSIDMIILQTIKLDQMCVYGISYVNDSQFIVAYSGKLAWVDAKTGTIVKDKRTKGNTCFVHAINDNEYIYAEGSDMVSLTVNDFNKFTYTTQNKIFARGIDIDFKGNIYIAGNGREDGKIHQITNSGELVRKIPVYPFGLTRPWIIRFKKDSNILLITCSISGKAVVCEIA
ncbi:unnamed protein product [Mytilus edulis]|uniref:B box-type domain-containing protein n=1 Tax=Mytilus edulis TaxID=6550 RepID=A0A8S3VB19_MYTED|nr:unnamed protein product [Mytilus edulis]